MLDFRQSTLLKRTQRHHPKMLPRSPLVRWLFRSTLALFATLSVLAGVQARAEPGGSLTFIEVRVEARGHVANIPWLILRCNKSPSRHVRAMATWALWPDDRPSGPVTLTSSAGGTASRSSLAFAATRAAREFRQLVGPMSGSPYDERSFRRVD